MALPAVRRLREAHPEARITLVTPRKLDELWAGSPFINDTLAFSPGESVWSVSRRVRQGGYDLGLILPNSPRSALELWLGGVPRRVGGGGSWRRLLLTEVVPPPPGFTAMRKRDPAEIRGLIEAGSPPEAAPPAGAHQIYHYLHLAASVGASPAPAAPAIPITPEEAGRVRELFGIPGDSSAAPVLGLNAGAEYGPAKRWPAAGFIEAARELRRQTGCVWVLFGGEGDRAVAGEIEKALRQDPGAAPSSAVVNLAGRTTLRQVCAALRACRVVLTNDTGPMHLAAAAGARVVALFGSTSPGLTGPGLPGDPRHKLLQAPVPCQPCFLRECPVDLRCLQNISPAAVVEAVRSCLG